MIILTKKVKVDERYKEFLRAVSNFNDMGLSDREIQILDGFYWASDGVITSEARKSVAADLEISIYNLNNQLSKLRDKKIIVKSAGKKDDVIAAKLMPNVEAEKNELTIGLKLVTLGE